MKKRVKEDSPRIQSLKEKARKTSVKEGSFASLQYGFGDSYVPPFALEIGATNSQIAMLTSLSGLLGPIGQLIGSRAMENYSRKKIVVLAILFQILMWIPMIVLGFLFWKGIWTGYLPLMLIIFYSSYTLLGNYGSPAWFSWMGDIVNEQERGRYFSNRNRINGFYAILFSLVAAFFLDFFKDNGVILFGFILFFFIRRK